MSVSSEAVVIRIEVQDANSGPALNAVTNNLTQVGGAGTKAGAQVADGLKQISGHALTALDNVRLLRDDIGIRIPRSMERAIAQSQILSSAIGSIGTGLIAIGAVDIGIHIAEGLKHAYDGWFSAASAARAYQEEVRKAQRDDFTNTRSIEDTRLRIDEATQAVARFQAEAKQAREDESRIGGNAVINPLYWVEKYHERAATSDMDDARRQVDKLAPKGVDQAHERNIEMIDYEHSLDARLRGQAKITAELWKQKELNAESRRYEQQMDSLNGNPVSPDSGKSLQQMENGIAERQAQAQRDNEQREHTRELARLQEQALESRLRGSALFAAQENAAIAELKDKEIDSTAAEDAVHEKFHNEQMRRFQEERDAVGRRAREAEGVGLTGIAQIQYEGESRDKEILSDAGQGKYQSLNDAQNDRVSNWEETNAKISNAEETFTARINALRDEATTRQLSGFAKIEAEGKQRIDGLIAEFQKLYGSDPTNPSYAAHSGELNAGVGFYQQQTRDDKGDLLRRNEQETEQIESQARVKLLASEKQKTAAIQEEYEERLRKYQQEQQEELKAANLTSDEKAQINDQFNRRVAAAQDEANAEMRQQAQETAQKIAGELSGLFSAHPLQALERMGQKYAGEATAALLSRAMGGSATGGPKTDGLAALFSHLSGTPAANQHGATGSTAIAHSASTVAHADIHIDQASIFANGGGGSSFSRTQGATSIPGSAASGSTWMIPSGGMPSSGGSTGGFSGMGMGNGFGVFGDGPATAAGTPTGSAPPPGAGFAGYANTAMRGIQTTRSIAGMIGSGNGAGPGSGSGLETTNTMPPGQFNADGSYSSMSSTAASASSPSAYSQSMIGGGMTAQNTAGAIGPAVGLFSAYKQGGTGGMMSGAMSGAELGMMVGGPMGAAVGAAVGLAIGFMGGGEQARVYWLKQGRPRLEGDMQQFQQGGMDYLSAAMDMQQLGSQAKTALDKFGMTGTRYWENTAQPEIRDAVEKLNREQRAGRSASPASAAQYDIGADSVPRDGAAWIHENERIIPSDQNERITRAMESQNSPRMAPASQGGDVNLHFHSVDAAGARDLLMAHSETIRAALNKSFGDYGGFADVAS